jgi:hypothetical protein
LDEQPVYVNPLHVAHVRDYLGGGSITEIVFASPNDEKLRVTVSETMTDVVSRLDLAMPRMA